MIYETTVNRLDLPNALGQIRTILIKQKIGLDGRPGAFFWTLIYPESPIDREHRYFYNYFDTAAAARRSARRFMKSLAQ